MVIYISHRMSASVFDSNFKSQVIEFQSFYALSPATSGVIDRVIWASLLAGSIVNS